MSETTQIIKTLKRCLKSRGISYKALSKEIGLSEASIKRLFSEESFSLKRLEEVCKVLGLNFFDLASMNKQQTEHNHSELSVEQEALLAENPALLTLFYLLLNGWSMEEIVEKFDFKNEQIVGELLKLDQAKLIELHPNNRIKFLTSRNIVWRKNGPIRNQYENQIKEEFLSARFDTNQELLEFETGELSEASTVIFLRKLNRLLKDYNELIEMDRTLPIEDRISTGVVVAFRPWVFSLLSNLKKGAEKP